jgi:RND superfamily putative drug exporter
LGSALLRHPRRVLAGVLVCVATLAILGLGVEQKLVASTLLVPGTESARAEAQLRKYFGDSAPFAILLRGPVRQLERQGPALVRRLRRESAVTALSPWDRDAIGGLRPGPRRALILADFHVSTEDAVTHTTGHLNRLLDARVDPPVKAAVSSYASFLRGVKEAAHDAGRRAELIAIPVLLLVLLLVFRSPVAALIPICLGVGTVIAARGVLAVCSAWIEIDHLAVPVGSMMGLALGVDYGLLMVSRFREELAVAASPVQAATETRRTAGRTILIAGSTLFCSLLIAVFVAPGRPFASMVGGVVLVTALSVLMAWVAGPAVLTLLGPRVDRWRLGGPPRGSAWWIAGIERALRRPGLVALGIAVPMLLGTLPILGLELGPSGPEQLPKDVPVRREAALIDRLAGPGWSAPFSVVASTERGSTTEPRRLDALARWQRRIAGRPNVEAVIGPSQIRHRVASLRKAGDEVLAGEDGGRLTRVGRLGSRLGDAAHGVTLMRNGLAGASQGAGLLGRGSQRAASGALALSSGLDRASESGGRAVDALSRLSEASGRLADGQRSARVGVVQLQLGLLELLPNVARDGLGPLRAVRADLERRAAAQPELGADAEEVGQVVARLARARQEVLRLHRLAAKLHRGLGSLATGGTKLQRGAQRLTAAGRKLRGGLTGLSAGSERLVGGVSQLGDGAGVLKGKLAEGFHRAYPLQRGLRRASAEVSAESRAADGEIERLRKASPGLFDSGYFALSVLDGTPPGEHRNVGQAVDLNEGGRALQMLVVPKYPLNSPGSSRLYDDLRRGAGNLGADTHMRVNVGGGAAQLIDYGRAASGRIPLLVAALALTTFLMLVVCLRSLLLPAIAVLLNLATVAFAFGVLSLVSLIPEGYPLGGNRVLDVGAAMAIFGVAFGLSIDYAVFLLTRMREHYERHGDHAAAVAAGLEKTARVITGAAAIMGAVFITYASAPLTMITQLGLGLAVAVLLDATVVRIVLLPALMLLLGRRVWWLPRPLARILPHLEPADARVAEAKT